LIDPRILRIIRIDELLQVVNLNSSIRIIREIRGLPNF
jgi:hypothetical protein